MYATFLKSRGFKDIKYGISTNKFPLKFSTKKCLQKILPKPIFHLSTHSLNISISHNLLSLVFQIFVHSYWISVVSIHCCFNPVLHTLDPGPHPRGVPGGEMSSRGVPGTLYLEVETTEMSSWLIDWRADRDGDWCATVIGNSKSNDNCKIKSNDKSKSEGNGKIKIKGKGTRLHRRRSSSWWPGGWGTLPLLTMF